MVKESAKYFSLIKGIFKFGFKKPLIPANPSLIVWETTHRCNLTCRHCSASAGEKTEGELTTNQAKKVIDKLNKFGVSQIAFSGGEPLVRQDIFELTKYASDKGIYVGIDSNGTLITKEKAQEIINAGIKYVRVSIDGSNAQLHDSLRGVPGAFEKSIAGIKNVVGKLSTSICTTVTKQNYTDFENIINLAESLGVDHALFDEFIPVGRAKEIQNLDLSPQEREEFLRKLYKKMKESKVDIVIAFTEITRVGLQVDSCKTIAPTYNGNFRGIFKKTFAKIAGGCSVGRFVLLIKPNGEIHPCSFLQIPIGNALTDDLKKLWKKNPILMELRKRNNFKPECGICKYRSICGGCRARAYSYLNDYLGPDPGCIYNKK